MYIDRLMDLDHPLLTLVHGERRVQVRFIYWWPSLADGTKGTFRPFIRVDSHLCDTDLLGPAFITDLARRAVRLMVGP